MSLLEELQQERVAEEEISLLKQLQQERVVPEMATAQSVANPVGAFARNLQDKLFFNRGNEFSAGVQALPALIPGGQSFSDAYSANMAGLNQEQANLYANNPTAAQASEIAGLSIPAFGLGGLLSKAPMAISMASDIAAKKFMPRLLSNAIGGGSIAAAESVPFAVGRSESLQDIPGNVAQDATTAALFGGAGGGTIPEVFRAGGNVLKSLPKAKDIVPGITGSPLFPDRPSSKVATQLGRAFEDAGVTPEEALQRKIKMGPTSMLADTSEAARGQLQALANKSGTARDSAKAILRDRSLKQGKSLLSPFGEAKRGDTLIELERIRKEQSGPLYEQAYKQDIEHTSDLEQLYQELEQVSPGIWQKAKVSGINNLRAKGEDVTNIEQSAKGTLRPGLKGWDFVKKELYDMEDTALKGTNPNTTDADTYRTLRHRLTDSLDKQNDSYAKARKLYSETSKFGEGVDEFHKNYLTMKNSDFQIKWNKLSPEDKNIAWLGIRENMYDKIKAGPRTGDKTRPFDTDNFIEKLELMVGKDKTAKFMDRIDDSFEEQATFGILSGSPTARNLQLQADQAATGAADMAVDAVTGNKIGLITKGLKAPLNYIKNNKGLTREDETELANILMEQNPDRIRKYIEELQRRSQKTSTGAPGLFLNPVVGTSLLGASTGTGANSSLLSNQR